MKTDLRSSLICVIYKCTRGQYIHLHSNDIKNTSMDSGHSWLVLALCVVLTCYEHIATTGVFYMAILEKYHRDHYSTIRYKPCRPAWWDNCFFLSNGQYFSHKIFESFYFFWPLTSQNHPSGSVDHRIYCMCPNHKLRLSLPNFFVHQLGRLDRVCYFESNLGTFILVPNLTHELSRLSKFRWIQAWIVDTLG